MIPIPMLLWEAAIAIAIVEVNPIKEMISMTTSPTSLFNKRNIDQPNEQTKER